MFALDRENKNAKEMRMAVVETIQDVMTTNDKVVALEADLGGASGFSKIGKTNPERYLNVGIAEANMIGVAAGLSVTGYIPFVHTFGPFATRRCFDQIFLSGGYAGTTLNIYGSDPGFTVGPNGGTHTAWEDVALMRQVPGALVCDAADAIQLEWIIREFAKLEGVHYVRANRKPVANIYKAGSTFKFGKGNILKKGSDILLIATGQLVSDALIAAEILEKEGVSAEVVDMFTIKPVDAELVLKEAVGKKAVVTFENHSITGGLGSAVAEVLADNGTNVVLKRVGVNEQFGQVGTPEFLQKEFKLTSENLVEDIKNIMK